MKETTRIRLSIIEARYGRRAPADASDGELAASFEDDFRKARDERIAPLLQEIGATLAAGGHEHRVAIDEGARRPSVELHLSPRTRSAEARPASVIRMFSITEGARREIIAEVQLGRKVVELTRFREISELRAEVLEQMVVDAVEQVFAHHASG
ncbi:hypothetical protein A7982_13717 [Minicystis rosea]|nr:hypothetical protein A7982_13717 [Minicystis rosea]